MRLFLFTLHICLLFSLSGKGFQLDTPSNYHVQHFSDENGLPQNSVKQIATDRLGFIWLASEGGLVRFDGSNFQVYTKKDLGIPSDRIASFRRDLRNGDLYAVSEFNWMIPLKNGTILRDTFYNADQPIDHLDTETLLRLSHRAPTNKQIKALGGRNYYIIPGVKDNFFVYHNQTISFCQSMHLEAVVPFKGIMSFVPPTLQGNSESELAHTNGQLNVANFIEIDGSLFYHQNRLGDGFIHITPSTPGSNSQQNRVALTGDIERNPVFSMQRTNVRIIWNAANRQAFAYLHNHFYRIHFSGGQLKTSLLIKDFDFDKISIVSAYVNELDGSIFLGSITNGLFVLTPTSFGTLTISEKDGNDIFYAQAPYTRSSVVTPQGYVLARNTAPFKLIPDIKGHTLLNKFTLLRDYQHRIWFIVDDFIYRCSPDGKKEVRFWDMKQEPSKLYQGATGEGIWVGFKSGTVAYLTENQQKVLDKKIITKIPNEEITWLHQSDTNHIWIGTVNGLYSFNIKEKVRRRVSILAGMNIRSLYSPTPNQLWITTYGDGMFLLEKNKLTSFPPDLKKYLNYAHCMVEDDSGHFWITTNKGLFKAKKQDLLRFANGEITDVFYQYYTKNSGFFTNEFNGGCQPCGTELADSTISFPSLNGLVWFKPHLVKTASLRHPFIVQNVLLNGRSVPFADTLELPHNVNNLALSVVTPYFGNTNNLKFSYTLSENRLIKSEKWIPINSQTISINNLSPGDYILTIRKVIGFGNQYINKKIFIHVATPWFLQWWFIILAILSLLMLIFALVSWRTLYVVRQNRRLSSKIVQRTAELTEALNELKNSEQMQRKQLQIQARIIGVLSHDLRTPLKYISTNSRKYQHQIETVLPDFQYLYVGRSISESADKVYKLTDNLLTFIKATVHKDGIIKNELVNVFDLLAEKSSLFAQIAQENQTQIRVEVEKALTVNTTRLLLEIIIHNLIDNAVKATWGGTITLLAQQSAQQICISVIDTGSGMPFELADWLSKATQKTDSRELFPTIGLGLIEVREMAELLGIQVSIETGTTGTRVHLTL